MTQHVCIVGAGIVGCATAYALARDGWQVTLVDALPDVGQGASLANGAQLSYSYVEPLATPAALRALPGWLLSPSSPLRWRPRPDLAHLRWLAAFVRACRSAEVQRTTEALLALSFASRDTLHAWLRELPGNVHHSRPGKLVVHRDARKRAAVQRQLAWQRELGCRQRLVGADECIALEPALAGVGRDIAFGVWTEDEEVIDAALLAQALAGASGATLRLGQRALGFEQHGKALRLEHDRIEADHFIVTAGSASAALLRPLGIALPIEPIKGYSVTLPIVRTEAAPRASITDQARKIVFARLGEHLRVAGFAELTGFDLGIDDVRIASLVAAVRETFPGACDLAQTQPWAGLRPATPSSRPLIGATHVPNLWVNTGHGALGLTLAAGSAALLARLMRGEPARIDARPYAVTLRNAAMKSATG
jgi:D-amino-acid dehydrogenase